MNNLVGYGDESDEESPQKKHCHTEAKLIREKISPRPRKDSDLFDDDVIYSPRSGSSSPEDSDFREPSPPKRPLDVHSPSPAIKTPIGLNKVSSTLSLVSYGLGGEEENSFEQAERNPGQNDYPQSSSGSSEPRPPERQSQDDDRSDDERQIDEMLEDVSLIMDKEGTGSVGSATPQQEYEDSPRADNEMCPPYVTVEKATIPPEPETGVDPKLQARIEMMFQYKQKGGDFNKDIQCQREFLNPSSYESFINMFDLDEKGTNFHPDIFDPDMFPETCYYDKIGEEQRKIHEHQQANRERSMMVGSGPVAKKPKV